jgi:hypothetical protein
MEVKEMPSKKKVKGKGEKEKSAASGDAAETAHELGEPLWSVISFDKREASHLTYVEAARKLARLEKKGVAGLCLVTDAAAERMSAAH